MKGLVTIIVGLAALHIIPRIVWAQGSPGGGQGSPGGGQGSPGGGADGGGVNLGNPVQLENPLKAHSLMELIQDVIDIVLVFAVPVIVFFIILAGFNFVMAKGDPGKVGKARDMLLYVVIGGVLILGAQVLMSVIAGTVDEFRS